MKSNSFALGLFLAIATIVFPFLAAAQDGGTNSVYNAKEFSFSTFGTYQANGTRTGDSAFGVGVQADYFVTQNLGVRLATSKDTFDSGAFFQNIEVAPVFRLPVKDTKFAPYVFGGVGVSFAFNNDRYYFAGLGAEYRFTSHIGAFADAQYTWRDYVSGHGTDATLFRSGLRWTF